MKRLAIVLFAVLLALPARAGIDIQQVTTPGGINAWLVEEHSIPFVALELRFRGGASLDAPGKRGATNLMVALLEEGAGDLDAQEFAQALEGLAASFRYRASDDTVAVSAKFLTENRDAALELLRQSLVAPRFDEPAIERVRAQVTSIIRSNQKDPNEIAGQAFDRLAYGDHPYGSSRDGTLDSVTGLSREDLVQAHRDVFARDRIYVSAVGDITAAELAELLDDLLGGLPETGAPMPALGDLKLTGGVTVVDFQTPQAVALFGHAGIKRDDPDFFAAYLLNTILGGGSFESRLMLEVREKRGLTYGIYSYLVPKDLGELYMGSVASANGRIAEVIDVVRSEWDRLAKNGVTELELQEAKTYLTGSYPLRFDGNGPIANILVGMQMDGLPINYIATRNDKINAVTLDDMKRVAQRVLRPNELHFVVVGQPEGLESSTN